MAGKKEPGLTWRHTTVLVRADIFTQAQEKGIDISDTCNRALADLLGIDYRQQRLDDVPLPSSVIVARDGGGHDHVHSPHPLQKKGPQPPVINADDPKSPAAIAKIRKESPKKVAPAPVSKEPEKSPVPQDTVKTPAVKPHAAKPAPATLKKPAKKTGKEDLVKKFIAVKVIRDDSGEAAVPKEELYGIFSRWCREQKIGSVPEMKEVTVALKTRFAFKEKNLAGIPSWVHVRLK
jgi:hypothetical protein